MKRNPTLYVLLGLVVLAALLILTAVAMGAPEDPSAPPADAGGVIAIAGAISIGLMLFIGRVKQFLPDSVRKRLPLVVLGLAVFVVIGAVIRGADPQTAALLAGGTLLSVYGNELANSFKSNTAPLWLAVGLALTTSACTPGWRDRMADRVDNFNRTVQLKTGAVVDCYAPLLRPLVADAFVALVATVLEPSSAGANVATIWAKVKAAVSSQEALACAVAELKEAPPRPGKMGGEVSDAERVRAVVVYGAEQLLVQ